MVNCVTKTWTREEVIDRVTLIARIRLGLTLDQFVKAVSEKSVDECENSDVIALLAFLPDDDPAITAASAA